MDVQKYIKDRIDDQIVWHDKKSNYNKWAYYSCSIIAIVGSIVASVTIHCCEIIATVISALVAISVGMNNLFKFQKKWMLYRITSELLKSEKMKFNVKAGDYSGATDNSEKVLYNKIEGMLHNTNQEWLKFLDKETNE